MPRKLSILGETVDVACLFQPHINHSGAQVKSSSGGKEGGLKVNGVYSCRA